MQRVNWHHLYLRTAGGKDLSNHYDTQKRVIGSVESETCMKMLRNLSETLVAKFSATSLGYPR